MKLPELFEKIQRLALNRGILGALSYCFQRLIFGKPEVDLNRVHPFDQHYGTQTSGLLAAETLATGHPHDAYNTAYYGIAPSLFQKLYHHWVSTLASPDEVKTYSFIDMGAGKGRALLLASQFPFREVIGVELNDELVRIAEQNIGKWRQNDLAKSPLRILQQDASEFAWPQNPLLIYLFNPFGKVVLERLVAHLLKSLATQPRPTDILYVTPAHHDVLDDQPEFTRLWSRRLRMDPSDQAADLVSSASELCMAYRFRIR